MYPVSVTLSMRCTADGEPEWLAVESGRYCCTGHRTPDEAFAHAGHIMAEAVKDHRELHRC